MNHQILNFWIGKSNEGDTSRSSSSKDMAKADNYDFIGFPSSLVAFLKLSNYIVVAKLIFLYMGTTRDPLATPHTNLNIRTP